MDIIDYDIKKVDNRILVSVSVEDIPRKDVRLNYTTLHNVIYELTDGKFCITNKKGRAIAIRNTLEDCAEFLNNEFTSTYTLRKKLQFENGEVA